MFRWLRRRRRAAIRKKPFPQPWRAVIDKNVPYVARLPESDHEELFDHVKVFLAEKNFEGCGGLEMTDEIRVTIAAQACVLLLGRETDYYPQLSSILVYPSTYFAPTRRHDGHGLVSEGPEARLGESAAHGRVVLAWDSVLRGAANARDGQNVVFHELAHQLDQESGAGDGAPILHHGAMYATWAGVLGREFDELVRAAEGNHRTLIDHYGATNPAEFFAVVTETFFERPRALKKRHPELYRELQRFYRQDPATTTDA